jgi:hypothetical protein
MDSNDIIKEIMKNLILAISKTTNERLKITQK